MNILGLRTKLNKHHQTQVLSPCARCGRERWVLLIKGKPERDLCLSCAMDKSIERQCLICGKVFKVKRSRVTKGEGKYCSRKCSSIAYSQHFSGSNHPAWKGGNIKRICEECGQEFEARLSQVEKKGSARFCSKSCQLVYRRKHGEFNTAPNKIEQKLRSLLQEHNLPFKYVGDDEVWFGNRNPDFINTDGMKQVIELLGTYWHPLFDGADRIEHYKQYGFDCLAIWEDELADLPRLTKKIKRFSNGR